MGARLEKIVQAEELREARAAAIGRRRRIVLHHDAVAAVGRNRQRAIGEAGAAVGAERRSAPSLKLPTVCRC